MVIMWDFTVLILCNLFLLSHYDVGFFHISKLKFNEQSAINTSYHKVEPIRLVNKIGLFCKVHYSYAYILLFTYHSLPLFRVSNEIYWVPFK